MASMVTSIEAGAGIVCYEEAIDQLIDEGRERTKFIYHSPVDNARIRPAKGAATITLRCVSCVFWNARTLQTVFCRH